MNSIAIDFGFITISWYAIIIVSAIIIGMVISDNEVKKHNNFSSKLLSNYMFWMLIYAVLGARLWYVTFEFENYYSQNILEIFNIKNGGMAIHGSILAGIIYTFYFSKKNNLNFHLITDITVPSLMIGQSIGRWGNFVNQEAYGSITSEEFLSSTLHLPQFIVSNMYINGQYHHPTFLYESILNLIGFLIIIFLIRRKFRFNYGIITSFYLIWYGCVRIFIEQLRTDALTFGFVKVAQVASILMIIYAIVFLVKYLRGENKL